MKRIAILGFSREGKAVLRFLKHTGQTSDRKLGPYEFWILDQNTKTEVPRRMRKVLGKNYLENLLQFNIIYRSPGIPYGLVKYKLAQPSKVFAKQKLRRVKISSATELFFKHCPCTIIGVTGTKGKSTTSTLLYKMLRAGGKDAYLAGNIGKPALSILHKLHKNSTVVFELSSFQLQELPYSPHIAVILDTFPDHMDAHKSFKEYIEAKTSITSWQRKSDIVFYFADSKYAKAMAEKSHGKKIPIQSKGFVNPNIRVYETPKIEAAIKIPGEHQLKNALMAASVARHLGISEKTILRVIASFHGLPHRLELVGSLKYAKPDAKIRKTEKKFGVVSRKFSRDFAINFYNDSAGTNPHTAAAAVAAFQNPVILIAGGKDKNLDYAPLARVLRHSTVKAVVLYGENRHKISNQLTSELVTSKLKIKSKNNQKSEPRIIMRTNLASATKAAYEIARSLITSYQLPVTVLLSPASASFDQFRDYKDRGGAFKKIVDKLR